MLSRVISQTIAAPITDPIAGVTALPAFDGLSGMSLRFAHDAPNNVILPPGKYQELEDLSSNGREFQQLADDSKPQVESGVSFDGLDDIMFANPLIPLSDVIGASGYCLLWAGSVVQATTNGPGNLSDSIFQDTSSFFFFGVRDAGSGVAQFSILGNGTTTTNDATFDQQVVVAIRHTGSLLKIRINLNPWPAGLATGLPSTTTEFTRLGGFTANRAEQMMLDLVFFADANSEAAMDVATADLMDFRGIT